MLCFVCLFFVCVCLFFYVSFVCLCFFVFIYFLMCSGDAGVKRPHYAYQLILAFLMTLANDAFSAQTVYSNVSTLKNGQKSLQKSNIGLL